MPNMPTRETIAAQHPNHYSIEEAASCYTCNPYELSGPQYHRVLDEGGDPSQMHESDILKLQERGVR
jgi:hypothetical protein